MEKPNPRIYRLACERLGVEPAECLFVDDQPAFVEGARAAGLDAVLIAPPPGAPEPEDAERWNGGRVASLEDVLALA